jgi:hypothetical protein
MSAIAYYILQSVILAAHEVGSPLRVALGRDLKGKLSPAIYVAGIAMAFVNRWISVGLYVFVALMWLVPDRRIEALFEAEALDET